MKTFLSENRNAASRTIVRQWTDSQPVVRFTRFEGFVKEDELPIKHIETEDGVIYDIPYNPKTGTVSNIDLFQRFLDVWSGGKPGHKRNVAKDISKTASRIYEEPLGGWTPEALIECGWWQRPNLSDIKGIDDLSGLQYIFDLSDQKTSIANVGKKIAVYARSPQRKREIEQVLRANFTDQELRTSVKNGGIIIQEGDPGEGNGGYYQGKQPGVRTPLIMLMPNADEDTITHEFVHHLRREDPYRGGVARAPYPLDKEGILHWTEIPPKDFESMRNLEEAATVFEAAARTQKPCKRPTGYYQYTATRDKGVIAQYDEDRALLGGKPLKGAYAQDAVEKNFARSNISTLRYSKGGMQADAYLEQRKARGDLPKAKPRRKSRKRAGATNPVSARPMATANRKWRKV